MKFPTNLNEEFNINNLEYENKIAFMNMSYEEISKLMNAYSENKDSSLELNLLKFH